MVVQRNKDNKDDKLGAEIHPTSLNVEVLRADAEDPKVGKKNDGGFWDRFRDASQRATKKMRAFFAVAAEEDAKPEADKSADKAAEEGAS